MTYPDAIARAIPLIQQHIETCLDSLVSSRVYYQQSPEQATLPCIVWHSQDAGGDPVLRVGSVGWRGAITVRAFDKTRDDVEALAQSMLAALTAQVVISGRSLSWSLLRPVTIPPGNQRYVAGFVFSVEIN